MTAHEALAVVRLRQWSADRAMLRHGTASDIRPLRGTPRRAATNDARIVRVLAFEEVFGHLDGMSQALLAIVYRDGLSQDAAARAAGISPRAVSYKLPAARLRLAELLDKADML